MVKRSSLLAAAAWLACTALLFLPLPEPVASGGTYAVQWESGTREEAYAAAYGMLAGADGEALYFVREGERGYSAGSEAYRTAYAALDTGGMAELASLSSEGCTALEQTALVRAFADKRWYMDGLYAYEGALIPSDGGTCRRIAVLSGFPARETLVRLGCTALSLGEGVGISSARLMGTKIARIGVSPPYRSDGTLVTLAAAGGERVVCAAPAQEELTLPDAVYDEGALACCASLTSLTFCMDGCADGMLASLFLSDGQYRVPASLSAVTVTGGRLQSAAFYACPGVTEIDACALSQTDISVDAFLGAEGLERLHCPRADVRLAGSFSAAPLPCGCTLFQKR